MGKPLFRRTVAFEFTVTPNKLHPYSSVFSTFQGTHSQRRSVSSLAEEGQRDETPPVSGNSAFPTFTDINFTKIGTRFDEEGNLLDEAYEKRAAAFIDELVWMATTLRWGRENVASKYHQDKEQVSE